MSSPAAPPVSAWVARFAALAPPGEVLDLACGGGRHARHFAALGHAVLALDRDPALLDGLAGLAGLPALPGTAAQAAAVGGRIATLAFDLEDPALPWPFAPARFAAIVVTNYLHRPLMGRIAASLAPGGVLIYETFAAGNEAYGKPSNPAFLLAPGELLAHAAQHGLGVVAFEDGLVHAPRSAMVQRLCACAPGFARQLAVLDGARQAVPSGSHGDSSQE